MMIRVAAISVFVLALGSVMLAAGKKAEEPKTIEEARPKVAFFPLGGTAKEALREQCGFSLRAKLDRAEKYDVIDGPKMKEIAAEAGGEITFGTEAAAVMELGKMVSANVLVWGELTNTAEGATMKLKVLDLRDGAAAKPREMTKIIKQPTDLRFVSEEILQTLPGVEKFEHPVEESVFNDATAEKMWKTQPNQVENGDFSAAGGWKGIYMSEYYDTPISDKLPPVDKVVIYKMPDGNNVLAMNLSRTCAENNGMACLSERIEIAANERYRLSFRYKSDGPTLHVFVKGYTLAENIKGEKVEREIYRRQVPPSGATNGQWVTVVDDLNPQHVAFPVQFLRVDLYAYLSPGMVMFDDVVLKPVGKQTRKGADEAIKRPVTRPTGAK